MIILNSGLLIYAPFTDLHIHVTGYTGIQQKCLMEYNEREYEQLLRGNSNPFMSVAMHER